MNKRKIEKKLEKLEELLEKIEDVRVISPDDPETWDSDALYDLEANCEEIIKLLQDKLSPKERNKFGEPLVLEEGLCSLMDDYTSEKEDFNGEEKLFSWIEKSPPKSPSSQDRLTD